jgi:hypothetical protein
LEVKTGPKKTQCAVMYRDMKLYGRWKHCCTPFVIKTLDIDIVSIQLHPPAALPPAACGHKARRVSETVWSRWRTVTPCLYGDSNPSFIKMRKTKEVQGASVSVCLTTSPENVCRLLLKKIIKKSDTKEGDEAAWLR